MPSLMMSRVPSCVMPHPSPAYVEPPELPEGREIVDEAHVGDPRELQQLAAPLRQSLAEQLTGEHVPLHDFPGLEANLAQCRPAELSRALEEEPVVEDQPLGEGLGIVRVLADHLVSVDGWRWLRLHRLGRLCPSARLQQDPGGGPAKEHQHRHSSFVIRDGVRPQLSCPGGWGLTPS